MNTIYHWLGFASFWSTVGIAALAGLVALRDRHHREQIESVIDPFTRAQTQRIELRLRSEVFR